MERYFDLDPFPHDTMKKFDLLLDYGEVYMNSVNVLLDNLKNEIHTMSPLPLLFLLRHYVELKLKGLILFKSPTSKIIGQHDLVALLKKLKSLDKNVRVTPEAEKWIYLLEQMDKKSQGFRYPFDRKGVKFSDRKILLGEVRNMVEEIFHSLVNVEGDYTGFEY